MPNAEGGHVTRVPKLARDPTVLLGVGGGVLGVQLQALWMEYLKENGGRISKEIQTGKIVEMVDKLKESEFRN